MRNMIETSRIEEILARNQNDSFMCVTWPAVRCSALQCVAVCCSVFRVLQCVEEILARNQNDSFICATWLIHMCDISHSCVRHDSFIRLTWLIHMCDMTHSYVWHDAFMRLTDSFIHTCDMTPSSRIEEMLARNRHLLTQSVLRPRWVSPTNSTSHLHLTNSINSLSHSMSRTQRVI